MNRFSQILTLIILFACETTQTENPEIYLSSSSKVESNTNFDLLADNVSFVFLEVDLKRSVGRNEKVTVTSNEGSLFLLDETDFSKEVSVLDLPVVEEKTQLIFRAGLNPTTAFLSIKADKKIGYVEIDLGVAYPEKLRLSAGKSIISLNSEEKLELTAELLRTNGICSKNQEVTFTADNPALVDLDQYAFSDEDGLAKAILIPKAIGIVKITATVKSDENATFLSDIFEISIE